MRQAYAANSLRGQASPVWESWRMRNPTVVMRSQTRRPVSLSELLFPHLQNGGRSSTSVEMKWGHGHMSCLLLLPGSTLLPISTTPKPLGEGRAEIWTLICLMLSPGTRLQESPVTVRDMCFVGSVAFPATLSVSPSGNIRVLMDLLSLTGWPASSTLVPGWSFSNFLGLEIWSSFFSNASNFLGKGYYPKTRSLWPRPLW